MPKTTRKFPTVQKTTTPEGNREYRKLQQKEFRERKKAEFKQALSQAKERSQLNLKLKASQLKNNLYVKLINIMLENPYNSADVRTCLAELDKNIDDFMREGNTSIDAEYSMFVGSLERALKTLEEKKNE
jgi:hypothetical protein